MIFRLEILDRPTGIVAYWDRPENFLTDGETFSDVKGPLVRRKSSSVKLADGDLELTFEDPRAGSTPDIFRLHQVDCAHISVTYEHTTYEPFEFVRTSSESPFLGRWKSGAVYVRRVPRPTNLEMTSIFEADQADRRAAVVDWPTVTERDRIRRERTGELLDSGQLQSSDDYYHAAFIFQHGNTPDDFLKAHLLAMVAVARGKSMALWIASASLDRYLQSIGRSQVLGTQFTTPANAQTTQEPFNRSLIPDEMRRALQVPSLSEQNRRRQQLQAKADTASIPPQ